MPNWLVCDRKFTKIVTNHLRLHERETLEREREREREREGGREGEEGRVRERGYIEGGREKDMMT